MCNLAAALWACEISSRCSLCRGGVMGDKRGRKGGARQRKLALDMQEVIVTR